MSSFLSINFSYCFGKEKATNLAKSLNKVFFFLALSTGKISQQNRLCISRRLRWLYFLICPFTKFLLSTYFVKGFRNIKKYWEDRVLVLTGLCESSNLFTITQQAVVKCWYKVSKMCLEGSVVCTEISALSKTSWSREHLKWDLKNEVYLNREIQ